MPAPTRAELAELLTPEQRKLLVHLQGASAAREQALDNYGEAIVRCHKAGVSFGMMAEQVNGKREAIHRSMKRYLTRNGQEYDSSRVDE